MMTNEQKDTAMEAGFPFLPEKISPDTALEAGFPFLPTEEE